tara:strand:+ start:85 stop:426 length:342 start_codon:yes stop_codon:yes gene_type:complete
MAKNRTGSTQSQRNIKERIENVQKGDITDPDFHIKSMEAMTTKKDKERKRTEGVKGKEGTQSGVAKKDKKKGGGYVESKGGSVKTAANKSKKSSASKRADGIVMKGRTKGRFV